MAGRAVLGGPSSGSSQQQPARERGVNLVGGGGAAGGERYFSVRWMLERERAREASDECSSAFAIIPVGEGCCSAFIAGERLHLHEKRNTTRCTHLDVEHLGLLPAPRGDVYPQKLTLGM